MSVEELVKELREQERSLLYNAIEYGCVDSGIAANVASQAADKLEELAAENERLRQTLQAEIEKAVQKWGDLRNDDATRRGVAFAADILRAALKEASE